MEKRYTILLLIVLLFSSAFSNNHFEADAKNGDAKFKLLAVYVYNFTKYINWPSDPKQEAFTIGFLGTTQVRPHLEVLLKGRGVNDYPVKFVSLSEPSEASKCQIVYVSWSKSRNVASLHKMATTNNFLVVSEKDMCAEGAAISFVAVDQKLKFKINQQAIDAAGLQIGQQLLALGVKHK